MAPRALRILFTALALAYFVLPRDLIPDALGILGRLDDLLIIWFLYSRYKRILKAFQGESQAKDQPEGNGDKAGSETKRPFDPYEVLGVPKTASAEEIRTRYRELAHQYHPDRVSHLGPELQKVAHEKMIEIQKAYEMLGGG